MLPKRNEVPVKYTWDLTRIFKDDATFEADYKVTEDLISKLPSQITDSAKELYDGLTQILEATRKVEKLYVYASMSSDVDTSNSHYLGLFARCQKLFNNLSEKISFLEPALLSIADQWEQYLTDYPQLRDYQLFVERILDKKAHTLDAQSEKLIAQAGDALDSAENTYGVLTDSDMEYGYVQDENGEMVKLSDGLYSILIQSKDRNVRKNAFDVMYEAYGQFGNTLASTLSGVVKKHNFNSKAHHYKSARQAALAANNVPEEVYDTLITEVNKHLDLLHEYVALRKKILKLDDLQMWDMYVPITSQAQTKVDFETAKKIAQDAFAYLGEDYQKHVDHIFNDRVIDLVESENKRTGAYSGGSYDTDPYILLNWEGTLDSVYTLVHETGHSMHSYYTRSNQPYVYGEYPIFLAEIASTTNENILTEYLLDHETDPQSRAYLLNYYLDSVKGTLFRQTQFAEFEEKIHEADQNGIPLTREYLDKLYGDINQKYYGDSVEPGGAIAKEWSRIPHFYYNFYVYQYATGFAAANSLANKVVHGSQADKEAYLGFLKAGSSDYPTNTMKKAGVDMTKADYLEDTFNTFAKRLKELKEIIE
ncbi:MAG: oligoendopeptidase F [Lactobacillus sp.]|nr:oligoendopeptidase F [Lactobacillus sp.]